VTRIWGIHNDQSLDLVAGSFVSIGWSELGDLSGPAIDRSILKERLATALPEAKAGAIPIWAGILSRFMYEMKVGDLVVSPDRLTRTINIGRISSNHFFDNAVTVHPNRRSVEWLKLNIPRSDLPVSALNEIGSAMTLFEVRRHKDVIERLLQGIQPDHHVKDNEEEGFEDEPNAQRVETYSRDFVEGILRGMEPVQFENLIAAVLRAMGYHAEVTQLSGDGGVDVLASHDPLRLQPPTIKVQVKRTTSSIGGPAVQALLGTLAPGGSELALFVTLGNYSNDATHIARTRQDIRLLSGAQLIDLVFEYYNKLDSEWQRLLPLRLVYAVDRDL
jgi:restriction system protein